MTRALLHLAGVASVVLAATPLAAQRPSGDGPRLFATGVVNYFWSAGPTRGISGTLGAGVSWRMLRAHLQLIDVGHVHREDVRDYWWQLGDLEELECRRRETGELVGDVYCEGLWSIASAAELLYTFDGRLPVMVGGGYRIGDNATAFGTLAIAFSPLDETFLQARVSAGRDFTQIGLGVGWPR